MKKFYYFSTLILASLFSMHLAHADQNGTPDVDYVQHVVVNNCFYNNDPWSSVHYELTEPMGIVHKGHIYTGTDTINLDKTTSKILTGVYVLRYSYCAGNFFFPDCHSYSSSVNIKHNANVIWELNLDGIKLSQIDV